MKMAFQKRNNKFISDRHNLYEESQFDLDKDKTEFRQNVQVCDRVRVFYREQHEKQTVAYNLKARHDFKSQTRAAMA